MRRRVVRVAWRVGVLLFVGAVVNVGVAWWYSALTMNEVQPILAVENIRGKPWPIGAPEHFPPPDGYAKFTYNSVASLEMWEWSSSSPGAKSTDLTQDEERWSVFIQYKSGFPCKALGWQESESHGNIGGMQDLMVSRGRIALPRWCQQCATVLRGDHVLEWTLPLHVFWPAFLANTGLFSGLLLAGVGCFRLIRSAWSTVRARDERCGTCGYEKADLSVCPECGR
jgi:hypothetical protein